MKRKTKIWLMTATLFIIVGLLAFVLIMSISGWNFNMLSTVKMQTITHEISQNFNQISIETETADIRLVKAVDGVNKAVCYEEENLSHTVEVQDGVLTVKAQNQKAWYEYIGVNFTQPTLTLYVTETEFTSLSIKSSTGDVQMQEVVTDLLKIETSTGDIDVENSNFGTIDIAVSTGDVELKSVVVESDIKIAVSTGDVELSNVTCRNLNTNGSTGDIVLRSVKTIEKMTIKRSTGDVQFALCDAGEILVKTFTGDVKGSLVGDKDFVAKSDTGSVKVPETHTGGKCEITTTTGDIKIEIKQS